MGIQGTKSWTDGEIVTATLAQKYWKQAPPRVEIDPLGLAADQSGFDFFTLDAAAIYGAYLHSSGSQGDYVSFDVLIGKGQWTFELMHLRYYTYGIVDVELLPGDGTTDILGSIDQYSATTAYNVRSQLTGIVIPRTGIYRLKLLMVAKNASSSGYYGSVQRVTLWRTD